MAKRTQDSASEIGAVTKQLAVDIDEAAKASDRADDLGANVSSQAKGTSTAVKEVLVSIQDVAERQSNGRDQQGF